MDTRRRSFQYGASGRLSTKSDERLTSQMVCDDPLDITTCQMQQVWVTDSTAVYAYDRVGNRTDGSASLQANSNRYSSFRGYTLAYDDEGNLTSKTASGYSQTYTWNELGQLASVTTNGTTVSYVYDAFGRRVKRTQGSSVRYYVYDGADLLLELDGNGNVLREYAYYPGVDNPHSMRVWSGSSPVAKYYTTTRPSTRGMSWA